MQDDGRHDWQPLHPPKMSLRFAPLLSFKRAIANKALRLLVNRKFTLEASMFRTIRRWLKVKCLAFELDYKLAVRKYGRDARNEQARRGADTALANRIDQQQQFWGIGA
jgi:hypothetical protein